MVAGLGPFALVRRSAGQGHARSLARDPAPLRYVGVRPIDSEPVDGPPSSAHSGRNSVEGGRFSGPCGPGAHSRASQKTNLRLRRHSTLHRSVSRHVPKRRPVSVASAVSTVVSAFRASVIWCAPSAMRHLPAVPPKRASSGGRPSRSLVVIRRVGAPCRTAPGRRRAGRSGAGPSIVACCTSGERVLLGVVRLLRRSDSRPDLARDLPCSMDGARNAPAALPCWTGLGEGTAACWPWPCSRCCCGQPAQLPRPPCTPWCSLLPRPPRRWATSASLARTDP